MTYVEGASLHQERGGSTVFARYAFNELVSFIAGWAILLDYVILIAVTRYSATQYLRVFWHPLGHRAEALLLALAIIAFVVLSNIRGFGAAAARRIGALVLGDSDAAAARSIVLGLVAVLQPATLRTSIHLGSAPTWSGLIFALTITTIAFTSLESASGLAGEVRDQPRGPARLVASGTATVVLAATSGIALVAVTALPVHGDHTALGHRYLDAPVLGIVSQLHPHWLRRALRYVVGALATLTLVAAANSAMLGLSRLAYSLSTNRQIPSGLGRLHPQRSTPYVLIVLAGVLAAALVVPGEPRLPRRHLRLRRDAGVHDRPPVGLPAALLASPTATAPTGCRCRCACAAGSCRCRRCSARCCRGAGWIAVMVVHEPARYVGLAGWRSGCAVRRVPPRGRDARCCARVTVRREVLRAEPPRERDYGSILVPLFGHRARRRHRADRGAAGRRRADRRGGDRQGHDRGGVDLRDPDVAAARRAPARGADQATRARRSRAPRRWARSTPASRWRRPPCARGAPGTRSSRRPGAAGWRRSCSAPRSLRGFAAARAWAAAAGRWRTSSGTSPSTSSARRPAG